MSTLTLAQANEIVTKALEKARALKIKPVTVVVLDDAGHLKAMQREDGLTPAQAIMSANAPMIIQRAMVEGKPAEGVLPSGQVAGVITDLPSCAELIARIAAEAAECLSALAQRAGPAP